jgi:hypothetical protein
MQKYVIGFEPYNERLCKLRINNITLTKEETKEEFCDNL